MKEMNAYRNRPIRFLDLWQISDWRLKVYGITHNSTALYQALIDAARRVTVERLVNCACDTNHYGVGFVGIHQGKTRNFVFVDWWAEENELHHHSYVSSSLKPADLQYMTPTGLTGCVWDLYLIGHERDAWINCVLKKNSFSNLDEYLNEKLKINI